LIELIKLTGWIKLGSGVNLINLIQNSLNQLKHENPYGMPWKYLPVAAGAWHYGTNGK
jgi:hypothetical protein